MAVAILSRERLRTLREFAMTQVSIADACARRAQLREHSESVNWKRRPLPVVERRPRRAGALYESDRPHPIGRYRGGWFGSRCIPTNTQCTNSDD